MQALCAAARDELLEFLTHQKYCVLSTTDGADFPHGLPARMMVRPNLTIVAGIPTEQLRRPARFTTRPRVGITVLDLARQCAFQGQGEAQRLELAELPADIDLEFQPSSCWVINLSWYQLTDWGLSPFVEG